MRQPHIEVVAYEAKIEVVDYEAKSDLILGRFRINEPKLGNYQC